MNNPQPRANRLTPTRMFDAIIGSLGRILGHTALMPAWDIFESAFSRGRVRAANLTVLTILACITAIIANGVFESAVPLLVFLAWMVGFTLILATDIANTYAALQVSLAWPGIFSDAVRTVLLALGVPGDKISQALDAVKKAMTEKAAKGEMSLDGAIASGLAAAVTVIQAAPLTAAVIPQTTAEILAKIEAGVKAKYDKVLAELNGKGVPFGKRLVQVIYYLCLFFGFFMFRPFWYNVWGAKGIVACTVLSLLAVHIGNRLSALTKPMKIAIAIGLGIAGLYWLSPQSFDFLPPDKSFWVPVLGIAVATVIICLRLLGTYHVLPAHGLLLFALTMFYPEQSEQAMLRWTDSNHAPGLYYRTVRVGGVPACRLTQSQGWLWFDGPNSFEPLPGILVDINTQLQRTETAAKPGPDKTLWIEVKIVDPASNLAAGPPFYVLFRDDFVQEITPPGQPVDLSRLPPGYDAGHQRMDTFNRFEFLDFAERKFGRSFVGSTWLGFDPVQEFYADPLDIDFEIGNGFESIIPGTVGGDYLGTDLYCDDINQVEIPVKASADGEIDGLTLNTYLSVTIRHPGRIWTHYGHLGKIASRLEAGPLRSGRAVKQGEVIGYLKRGQSFEPYRGRCYLYFTCIRQTESGTLNPVDPMPILRRAEYRWPDWKKAELARRGLLESDEDEGEETEIESLGG